VTVAVHFDRFVLVFSIGTLLGCNALLGTDEATARSRIASSTEASPDGGVDGANDPATLLPSGGSSGEGSASEDGPSGPGPHGSLPSGYCCTSDSECRFRNCAPVGKDGTKMCVDACHSDVECTRPELAIAFACSSSEHEEGVCQPTTPAECIPRDRFHRGKYTIGACCRAVEDGTNGADCEGGLCISIGWNGADPGPSVCSHACDRDADCPIGNVCFEKSCAPDRSPYTCR
jgi:hypothetical protein